MTEQCTVTVAADERRADGTFEKRKEGGTIKRTTFFGLLNFCVCVKLCLVKYCRGIYILSI